MKDMNFSAKLIEARNARGLTQEEVAEQCNLNVRTIQRIESGEVQPRAYTMRIISKTLEIQQQQVAENKSFIWRFKDLFNLKTHKMRKLTILSTTAILTVFAIVLISSGTQAQTNKTVPESGVTIQYNDDQTPERIDVVFTQQLTLDSLTKISETLAQHDIEVSYRKMSFDESGHLMSIHCDVSKGEGNPSGSFSIKELAASNKDRHIGFYFDYSKDADKTFCTGACW